MSKLSVLITLFIGLWTATASMGQALCCPGENLGGTCLGTETFESYASQACDLVANRCFNNWWTWPGNPVESGSYVRSNLTTSQRYQGNRSLVVKPTPSGGSPDLIKDLFDATSGIYRLSWKMRIPQGKTGYYNIQHDLRELFQGRPIWAYQVFFTNGAINLMVAGERTARVGSYQPDCWLKVTQVINLDQDSVELFVDNRLLRKWAFSPGIIDLNNDGVSDGFTRLKKLGGINFYAKDESFEFYLDQLCYQRAPVPHTGGPCLSGGTTYCLGGVKAYRPANGCNLPAYDGYVEGEEVFAGACRATSSACSKSIPIACNQTLNNQTTQSAGNDFSSKDYAACTSTQNAYFGPERVYRLAVAEATNIQINLTILDPTVNLDLFVLQNCQTLPAPPGGFGNAAGTGCSTCVGASTGQTTTERLSLFLEPGIYFLVVDGFAANQVGRFNLAVTCSCSCSEGTDLPLGQNTLCENFDGFVDGPLLPQSTRWTKWEASSADAVIVPGANNLGKQLRFQRTSTSAPDLLLSLDNRTTGRHRLSWNLWVARNQEAYYNIQHTNAGAANPIWAFEVFFTAAGVGQLRLRQRTVAQFNYANGNWNKVMQIIDLDKDLAELWINDQLVHTWRFSIGNPADLRQLGGVNFYAASNNHYTIDNFCMWSKTPSAACTGSGGPVCLSSGRSYPSAAAARCDLYTQAELGGCAAVCDVGGTLIGRGDRFSGTLGSSDLVPSLVYQDSCMRSFFQGQMPDSLYGRVFVFFNEKPGLFSVALQNAPGVRAFVYQCPQDVPGSVTDLLGYRCLGMDGQDFTAAGYYYILLASATPNVPYAFSILPQGSCRLNPTPVACNVATAGTLTGGDNRYAYQSGGINAYAGCYTGARTYTGEDKEYQFVLTRPSRVHISLQATGPLGVFLYDYRCGEACLSYAETGDTGGTATTDSLLLQPGVYYLILDRALPGGGTFNFTVHCLDQSANLFPNGALIGTCPPGGAATHALTLRGLRNSRVNGLPLQADDQIYFFHRSDSAGLLLANQVRWNGTEVRVNLPEDAAGDTLKCGYSVGENIQIKVGRNGVFYGMKPVFLPTDGATVTAGGNFQRNGASVVTGLSSCCRPSALRVSPTAQVASSLGGTFAVQVVSNLAWTLVKRPGADWIQVSQARGVSNSRIMVELAPNNTGKTRVDTLYIVGGDNEVQKVAVEQTSCAALAIEASPDQTICLGSTAELRVAGGGSYRWNTGATTATISVSPSATTVYSVTATQGGCTNTRQVRVVVNVPPVINLGPDQNICAGQTIILTAGAGEAFLWSTGETTPSITVRPTVTTGYSVAVTRGGCVGSDQVQINVGSSLQPAITPNTTICQGESTILSISGALNYQWSTGSTASNIVVTPATTTTYQVTLSDGLGCSATAQTTVTVRPLPTLALGADVRICNGESAVLTGSGVGQFRWNTGEITPSITVRPNLTTRYILALTSNGCTAVDTVQVSVAARPVVDLGPDLSICPGQRIQLTAPTGDSYRWSNGATTPTITINPVTATTFSVTVTREGCTASDQVQIVPINPPIADAGPDQRISCSSGRVVLDGSGSTATGVRYQWRALDGGRILSGETSLRPEVNRPGRYELTVTILSGGCSTVDEVRVLGVAPVEVNMIGLVQVRCPGEATGSIELNVVGGRPPYRFQWSNGASGQQIGGLQSGAYSVTVSDQDDCRDTVLVELTEPSLIRLERINVFPASAENTGSINITVRGGLPPYRFKWYNLRGEIVANSEDISGLASGDYIVEITDENDCAFRSSPIRVGSTITAVGDLVRPEQLLVFPNPSQGLFTVRLPLPLSQEVRLQIFNPMGQLIQQLPVQRTDRYEQFIDLTGWPAGMYTLVLQVGGQRLVRAVALLP